MAHLGYFREEFVAQRRWLDDDAYADLVALCQFLPGPASSQVALGLGWRRAGITGALLAWLGFTLPSAVLMLAFAAGIGVAGNLAKAGWVEGLKIAAVAVVAQALWQMAATLCPDLRRAALALLAGLALIRFPSVWLQMLMLALGALVGGWFLPGTAEAKTVLAPSRAFGWPWLAAFFLLLVLLPLAAHFLPSHWLGEIASYYRVGALVFGGGHVVLPLLEQVTVARGLLTHDTFLAGYGAAQALPGPLFAFAAYLGSVQRVSPHGIAGGLLALGAIYLPSFLLVFGVLPHWQRLRQAPRARALLAGTNAAVVGLLGAAFYRPVCTSALTSPAAFALALGLFAALRWGQAPPWLVVLVAAAAGQALF